MRCLITICFLSVLSHGRAQDPTKKIDSLLDKTWAYHVRARLDSAVETGFQALALAKQHQYEKGIAEGYFMVGDALANAGLYKEALKQFEAMERLKYSQDRPIFLSEIHRVKGRAYADMNLFDLALREYAMQLNLLPKIDEKLRKRSRLYVYDDFAYIYKKKNNLDSFEKYTLLGWELVKTLPKKESRLDRMQALASLGNLAIRKGELEKAQTYLDQAMEMIRQNKETVAYNALDYYAQLEDKRGNYAKSVDYRKQAIANAKELGNYDFLRDQYKALSDYYRVHKLGDVEANEYLLKYTHLSDSLAGENQLLADFVLKQVLQSTERENEERINRYILIAFSAVLVLLGVIAYAVWNIRRKRRLLGEQEIELTEMDDTNKMLSDNNKALYKQIEENKFSDLIELAKSNNPEFLILFSELYPEFIAALRELDPKIRSTELEFCAMAFLNFSTKNIAEYTFVTVRAVQVRKNRLRKKFNITSDEDFNNWMRKQAHKTGRLD